MIVEDKAFGDSEINLKKRFNGNDGNRLFIIKQSGRKTINRG